MLGSPLCTFDDGYGNGIIIIATTRGVIYSSSSVQTDGARPVIGEIGRYEPYRGQCKSSPVLGEVTLAYLSAEQKEHLLNERKPSYRNVRYLGTVPSLLHDMKRVSIIHDRYMTPPYITLVGIAVCVARCGQEVLIGIFVSQEDVVMVSLGAFGEQVPLGWVRGCETVWAGALRAQIRDSGELIYVPPSSITEGVCFGTGRENAPILEVDRSMISNPMGYVRCAAKEYLISITRAFPWRCVTWEDRERFICMHEAFACEVLKVSEGSGEDLFAVIAGGIPDQTTECVFRGDAMPESGGYYVCTMISEQPLYLFRRMTEVEEATYVRYRDAYQREGERKQAEDGPPDQTGDVGYATGD
jgi:hypothetical protein